MMNGETPSESPIRSAAAVNTSEAFSSTASDPTNRTTVPTETAIAA